MKKILTFLRSMTFGMLLLIAILACSFAGSMIPQQRSAMEYVERYGADMATLIMRLGLDDVFSAPYFIVLMAALCLNLMLCSVVRVVKLRGAGERLMTAAAAKTKEETGREKASAIAAYLSRRGYKKTQRGDATLFCKHFAGFYGSFLTHLALIVLLAVGAMTIYGAQVQDRTVLPGETLTLEDGMQLTVNDFRIEDETGKLDYASTLVMTDTDGKTSGEALIRVNEPLRFGEYKVYQQTYGTAGAIRVTNLATGGSETVHVNEPVFLTLDGVNGLFYNALYPGYIMDADGGVTLITSTSGAYEDPVYDLRVMSEGEMTAVLAFPQEEIVVGDVAYTMLEPLSFPGLRIKYLPGWILGALYASFALMVGALYVCFFVRPVCVAVHADGYAIAAPKAMLGLQLELDMISLDEEEESK